MGFLPSVLIAISTLTQGPLPVAQAATKAKTLVDSARVAVLTGVIGCGLVLLAVAVIPRLRFQFAAPHDAPLWLHVVIVGNAALYALANLLIVMATFELGPARFGIVFTLRVIPLAGISMGLLGEAFTWFAVVGGFIVVAGVFVAATIRGRDAMEKDDGKKGRPPLRAWLLAGGATLAFGSANAMDALVVKHMTAVTYAPIRLLLPALLTSLGLVAYGVVCNRKSDKKVKAGVLLWLFAVKWELWLHGRWRALLAIVALMPMSATAFMWAVQLTNRSGLLASIHQTSLFLTIAITALVGDKWKWRLLLTRLRRDVPRELRRYWLPALVCCVGVAMALGLPSLLEK